MLDPLARRLGMPGEARADVGGRVRRRGRRRVGLRPIAEVELDRDVVERQLLAEDVEQVALIGRVEERGAVDEQDDRRRRRADLGGVVDPRARFSRSGGRVRLHRLAEDPVQGAGADPPCACLYIDWARFSSALTFLPVLAVMKASGM